MTEVAKAKKDGTITTADGNPFSTSNFLRQFRDKDSRELQQLSAAQFMKVWEHYDEDGKLEYFFLECMLFVQVISISDDSFLIMRNALFIYCLKMAFSHAPTK